MSKSPAIPPLALGAAVTLVVIAGIWWTKTRGGSLSPLGAQLGGSAVDLADGIFTGVVTGIGERVGIPSTSASECDRAIAEGRYWDASFHCPAGTFIKGLFATAGDDSARKAEVLPGYPLTAADWDDADLGYSMDLMRAQQPFLGYR